MSSYSLLKNSIIENNVRIGVIGLGYVGLPLAIAFASEKWQVIAYDLDGSKITAIEEGKSYIGHIPDADIGAVVESGFLRSTNNFSDLSTADVLIICLPTPLDKNRSPDLSYVLNMAEQISEILTPGKFIVLESTTYPGTTEGPFLEKLERTGYKCGEDFFLAFSSEREDPANPDFTTTTIPKIIGGVGEKAGELAKLLFDKIISETVLVSSSKVAEATKLTENIYRAVNIALVNELKIIFDRMGIDVWEVLDAASTKPFGFKKFEPGPGWGGHCIPVDPFYLSWKAKEFGLSARFIEIAGEINTLMPEWIINKIQTVLNDNAQPVRNCKILLVGMAYKRDVGDIRESPALEIMDLLEDLGAIVSYHDPYVASIPVTRNHPDRLGMKSEELTAKGLKSYDAVVIVTDHQGVDYPLIANNADLVFDTRGVYHKRFRHLKDKVHHL